MKNFLKWTWYVLIWWIFSALCLATIPVYLVTYPLIWLVTGFKHIPWWWWATDWIEDQLPPHEESKLQTT